MFEFQLTYGMKRPNKNMQCSAIFVCRRWRCIYDFLLYVAVALDAFILKSDGEKLDKDGFESNNNMIIRFSLRFFGFHNTIMTQKSKLKQKAERAENYSAQMYCKKKQQCKKNGFLNTKQNLFFSISLCGLTLYFIIQPVSVFHLFMEN